MDDTGETSGPDYSGSGPVEYYEDTSGTADETDAIIRKAEDTLLGIPGIISVGIGQDDTGAQTLIVGIADAGVLHSLPTSVEGLTVIGTVITEVNIQPD